MQQSDELSFWQHLDVLRGSIIRMCIAFVVCSVVAFCLRDFLFEIVIAPSRSSFPVFVLLQKWLSISNFNLQLINTSLAGQFMTHIRMSLMAGLLLALPYILFELLRFISPALYESERRVVWRMLGVAVLMFFLGVAVAYFIIFPFTVLFLGSYQVSAQVGNMITIESYIGAMLVLLSLMGIVFELPVACYLLAKLGLLHYTWLKQYRKHAVVVIVVLAALITPSGDAFTMLITALPVYLLFELSVLVVKRVDKNRENKKDNEKD
ncbi:MAG: twin-arginine translocase subunit TatC [Paludibacteraceae bacterium]|nr:twin-arginine translocase subunit TatC [Paludibacteraceae bacterium]